MAGKQLHPPTIAYPIHRDDAPGRFLNFDSVLTNFHIDEPRRSVRATKGQHTKSLDLLDQPVEPKKKASKKAKKPEKVESEEEPATEVIRCVCGATETNDDEEDPWIACDNCDAWQHNICVGISRFEEDSPDNYKCELCDPTFPLHKELLDGMKKGKKLWEERRKKANQLLVQEKQAKKKGGKKKGSKRASEASELSHATNGKAKSPSVPVPAAPVEKKEAVSRAGSTKRKARETSHESTKVS